MDMVKKHALKILLAAVLMLSLSACNRDNNNGMQQRGVNDGSNGMGMLNDGWDNTRNNNFTSRHNNTRMEMSQEIADEIAKMRNVDRAYVLLTEKNAYVAVVLD